MKRSIRTKGRVVVLVMLVGLLFAPSFSGCRRRGAQTKVVRFGSFSVAVDYGPYLVAKNKGWFGEQLEPEGYKAEFMLFQSLPPINEAFATRQLDVVFEAEPPAIVAAAAGIDLRIVHMSCTLVQEIVVPMASEVKSAANLKGKKIAVLAGTSSHYGLLKILQDAGVDPDEVKIIDMVPPDAKNAFETGKVDAWAVWPPWVEQEEVAGSGRVLPRGDAVIHSIMAVRKEFAEAHPEISKKIVGVLDRAKKWMIANPDEAQEIVSKELDVPLEVVKKSWPRHDWAAVLDDSVIDDIEAKAKFLLGRGFIKRSVNVRKDLVDSSFGRQ